MWFGSSACLIRAFTERLVSPYWSQIQHFSLPNCLLQFVYFSSAKLHFAKCQMQIQEATLGCRAWWQSATEKMHLTWGGGGLCGQLKVTRNAQLRQGEMTNVLCLFERNAQRLENVSGNGLGIIVGHIMLDNRPHGCKR